MAHSHDNTLLKKMGFSDTDRRSPDHDDACVSLATEGMKVVRLWPRWGARDLKVKLEHPLQKGSGQYTSTLGFIDALLEWTEWKPDMVHGKLVDYDYESGRRLLMYRGKCNLCGFLSSEPRLSRDSIERCPKCLVNGHPPYMNDEVVETLRSGPDRPAAVKREMLVEVKTRIDGVGDLLRQMNLYREYAGAHEYVVWSLRDEDVRYEDVLKSQGYSLLVGRTIDDLVARAADDPGF